MATKRSTLVLCKDSVLLNNIDNLFWMHQYNMVPMQECICEDVYKWVESTKVIIDSVGASFLRNDVNGSAFLAMHQKNLNEIGATQVVSLDLLLRYITDQLQDKIPEAVFVGHNTY